MKTKQRWSMTQFWMITAATLLAGLASWVMLIAAIMMIGREFHV